MPTIGNNLNVFMTYALGRLPWRGHCDSLRLLPVTVAGVACCCNLGKEGIGSWEGGGGGGIRISSFLFLAATLTSTLLFSTCYHLVVSGPWF